MIDPDFRPTPARKALALFGFQVEGLGGNTSEAALHLDEDRILAVQGDDTMMAPELMRDPVVIYYYREEDVSNGEPPIWEKKFANVRLLLEWLKNRLTENPILREGR